MADSGCIIRFDGFEVDTERYELRYDGAPVHVEPKVFELLRYLVHNRERMVSKEELLEKEVWGAIVTESALTRAVARLRRVLGDSAGEPRYIETVHSRGYRFIASVAPASPATMAMPRDRDHVASDNRTPGIPESPGAPGLASVFFSYGHAECDEHLAQTIATALGSRQHPVFLDRHIASGTRWIRETEEQIRASAFFVVILSRESIRSDVVRQQVALAHQLERENQMRILPIRNGHEGELPYDLGSYLNRFRYAICEPGEPLDEVCVQVVSAVESTTGLPFLPLEHQEASLLTSSLETAGDAAPLPAAEPRVVMETGAVRLSSAYYVARSTDGRMEEILGRREGEMLVVKGARQSGKSSLLARAHALLHQRGHKTVYLDLQLFDEAHLNDLGSLLRNLAARIARDLDTDIKPRDVWDEDLGEKDSFVEFMQSAVLASLREPMLLCLDEVDRVFDRPYRADFFAAVRGWHNNRAIHRVWDRLHIAIAHATDPALWIDDFNQSPFNVGERLRLEDFTIAEIAELATRHGVDQDPYELAEDVRRLVGGHPYLVRQALYVLTREACTVAALSSVASDERGPFGDHLRQRLWTLSRNPRLEAAFRGVIENGSCEDEMDFQRLSAAGLVTGDSRHDAEPRCELYRTYFRRHLQ